MKFSEDSLLLVCLALLAFIIVSVTNVFVTLGEVDKVMQECEDALIEINAPRNTKCNLVLSYKTTNDG